MSIVRIKDLTISYDGKNNAVDRVSFDVKRGEFVCIVGESGSGKTTMLHSILKLLPQNTFQKGQILFEEQDILCANETQMKKIRGESIAMIFQDTGRYLNPTKNIGTQFENYINAHRNQSKKDCREIAAQELCKMQLFDTQRILASYPFELSGGMRQRVGMAMAMALEPKLLLADEPTSALDVTIQKEVVKLLRDLNKNARMTVIMVTHNIDLAIHVSDSIGVMCQGKLVEWGSPKEIQSSPKNEYTQRLLDSIIGLHGERLIERYG